MTNQSISQIKKKSGNNLQVLSRELALNYFNASTIDLFEREVKTHVDRLRSEVFDKKIPKSLTGRFSRNILVLGAGCTRNLFADILLANEAATKIQNNIVVHQERRIRFDYFSKFALQAGDREKVRLRDFSPEIRDQREKAKYLVGIWNKHKDHMLYSMGRKYYDHYNQLMLHSPEYGKKGDLDFETTLGLLSTILPKSVVSKSVQDLYNHRHGPSLFYELVAHMFKHRIVDVIINFNFDEFLDQAIAEELGPDGYDLVLTERDCRPIAELCENKKLRQPLYIKPHGTASDMDSLRFTKNHYYELPLAIKGMISDLIEAEKVDSKRTNLITVGFEMESLDLNEILKMKLTRESKIFCFYHHGDTADLVDTLDEHGEVVKGAITLKEEQLSKLLPAGKGNDQLYLIGHEFFDGHPELETGGEEPPRIFGTLGIAFLELYRSIESCFMEDLGLPKVSRHKLVAYLFGQTHFLGFLNGKGKNNYAETYFEKGGYSDRGGYYLDRTLVEILMSLSENKGCYDPPHLLTGTAGIYYLKYYKMMKSMGQTPLTLIQLINGLTGDEDPKKLPFGVNRSKFHVVPDAKSVYTQVTERGQVRGLFSNKLSDYLGQVNGTSKRPSEWIIQNFDRIRTSKRSRIRSKTRSRLHYIFEEFNVSNVLHTKLSIDLQYYESLRKPGINQLWIIAEHGAQLAKMVKHIRAQKQDRLEIRLILANYTEENTVDQKKLEKTLSKIHKMVPNATDGDREYLERILGPKNIKFLEVNRHNHHMALFLSLGDNGKELIFGEKGTNRAIYYYQEGLNQDINPIRLIEKANIEFLMTKFEEYWAKAQGMEG